MSKTSQMNGFIFYISFEEAIDGLPVKTQYELYKAIIRMSFYDEVPELSGVPKRLFAAFKPQIEANKRRYLNGVKGKEFGVRGKEYGVLGGRPRKEKSPSNSRENDSDDVSDVVSGGYRYNPPNNPPNKEKEKENININLKDKNKTNKENIKGKTKKENEKDGDARVCVSAVQNQLCELNDFDICAEDCAMPDHKDSDKSKETIDCGAVIEDYNRICVSLPAVKCLTDARRTAINAKIAEHGFGNLHEVFVKAEKSDFLCGRNRPTGRGLSGRGSSGCGSESTWRASFDWLLDKANFVKVLEGNYDPKPSPNGLRSASDLDDLF